MASSSFPKPLWVYCGIVLLTVLLYANTFRFSYAGDDIPLIVQNKTVQAGWTKLSDLWGKSTFYGYNHENFGAYRPLTMFTFATEVQLWGNRPALSHWINVLLYALCGCMLYRVLCLMMGKDSVLALLVTLLFLAHPVHTEVVANIKSRDELLAFLFGFLLPLLLLWQVENKFYIAGAYLCFFLGVLAKENALFFFVPVVMALYVFREKTLKQIFYYTVPFIVLAGAYLLLRSQLLDPLPNALQNVTNTLYHCHTTMEKIGTIVYMMWAYVKLLILPVRLSWDHSFSDIPVTSLMSILPLFSLLFHASLLGYAVVLIRKRSIGAYWILFYFATLFIYLNIFIPLAQNIAERFLLVPSLAFCVAVVLLLQQLSDKVQKSSMTLVYVACTLLLLFYSIRTVKRNPIWKNNDSFFSSVVKDAPNSFYAQQSLGTYWSAQADEINDPSEQRLLYSKAKECFERSLAIYSSSSSNWYMLGRCSQLIGDVNRAEQAYKKVLEDQTNDKRKESLYNLGVLYKDNGQFDRALAVLQQLNEQEENFNGAHGLMGESYLHLQQMGKAEIYLNKALAADSLDKTVLNNLGVLHYMQQHYTQAEKYFKQSVKVDSCFIDGLKNAAASCQVQQKYTDAMTFYKQAVSCRPDREDLYVAIISFCLQSGNAIEARFYEERLKEAKEKGLIH